jgi:gp32 DNA binding protein like
MNLNELRKKHEELLQGGQQKSSSGGKLENYLKVEPGKNIIRILPWKDDSKQFFSEAVIHRYESEDGRIQNYYCRKTQQESCPMCDFYFDLWKMHKELGLPPKTKSKFGDLATKIKGTPRYYLNVVDRRHLETNPEDVTGAVKILSTGQKVFKKIMDGIFNSDYMDENDPDNTTVLSLKKGNDFVLELGKSGEFNNYDQSTFRIKKTPAGNDREIRAWMESMHDIHALIKIGDYDDGKKIVDALRISVDGVRGPQKNSSDDDDDLGEKKFNKELKV